MSGSSGLWGRQVRCTVRERHGPETRVRGEKDLVRRELIRPGHGVKTSREDLQKEQDSQKG